MLKIIPYSETPRTQTKTWNKCTAVQNSICWQGYWKPLGFDFSTNCFLFHVFNWEKQSLSSCHVYSQRRFLGCKVSPSEMFTILIEHYGLPNMPLFSDKCFWRQSLAADYANNAVNEKFLLNFRFLQCGPKIA